MDNCQQIHHDLTYSKLLIRDGPARIRSFMRFECHSEASIHKHGATTNASAPDRAGREGPSDSKTPVGILIQLALTEGRALKM